jgi:hypothetical protein
VSQPRIEPSELETGALALCQHTRFQGSFKNVSFRFRNTAEYHIRGDGLEEVGPIRIPQYEYEMFFVPMHRDNRF